MSYHPAYHGLMMILSAEHLQRALETSGDQILGDISNFTNIQAILQVNTPLTA